MGPPEVRSGARRALKSTLAWTAAATALVLVQYVVRGPDRFWWLVEAVSGDVAGVLSFAAVAGGVRLAEFQGRRLRAAAVAGVAVAVAAYVYGGPGPAAGGVRRILVGRPIRSGHRDVRGPDSAGDPAEPCICAGKPAGRVQHVRRAPRQGVSGQARPFPSPSCGHGGDRASQHLRGTVARSGDPWDAPARPPSNAVVRGSGWHDCRRRRHLAGAGTEPGVGDRVRNRRGRGRRCWSRRPQIGILALVARRRNQPCAPLDRAVSSGGWDGL